MTPLSLSSSAAAGQSGAGAAPVSAKGAGKESSGFNSLLQAAPQSAPHPKPATRPSAGTQGRDGADAGANPAKPAETVEATGSGDEPLAAADKPSAPTAADAGHEDACVPDELPWPPPGLSGLLPVVPPAPATVEPALPTADALAAAPPAAPTPAASGPVQPAPPPSVSAQAAVVAPVAAARAGAEAATDTAAQLAGMEVALVAPRAAAESVLPTTDPVAGTALFAPLLQNLATVAEARPAPVFPPALSAPVDAQAPDFDEAIGARVGWLADQKVGHAHIRVTPHDLGPVEVKLQLEGDRVHAAFSSAHAEVRHALESGLPRLREMLDEQGLQLAHADVGHQPSDPHSSGGTDPSAAEGDAEAGNAGAAPTTDVRTLRLRGLLDAYA